jgi:hypothetical protein
MTDPAHLLECWEKTVRQVEEGWSLPWEDYVNDLDGRRILGEIAMVTPPELAALDHRFCAATTVGECLWGEEVAQAEGWDPEKNWYYYRHPQGGGFSG